jgi:hypothetical protein
MEIVSSQGNWDNFKTKIKNKYPQLTDADLSSSENSENDIMRMVEYKLGKTKQEMQEIIAGL